MIYTPADGSVLAWRPVESSNVGVVTKTEVVKVDNGYVIAYTILKPDGTETTIYGGNPADHYKAWEYQSVAEAALSNITNSTSAMDNTYKDGGKLYPRKDTLVKYTAQSSGYYEVKAADEAMDQDTDRKVLAGDAETIKSSGGTYPVNADTVFFIAQYVPDNTTLGITNDWTLTGYKVVKDFRDIQDLCLNNNGDIFANDALGNSVTRTSPNNLRLTWFNGERTSDGFLKYVLVTFATDQHDKATVPVDKYAYIKTTTVNVAVGSDLAVFPAIINGVETTLTMQYSDYLTIRANGPGLYKYTETGNNYVKIDKAAANSTSGRLDLNMAYYTPKDQYVYNAGVLTSSTWEISAGYWWGGSLTYHTVAKDVQVYLVNPTTGSSITTSLSALSTNVYGKDCAIWYQFDEYGWINYIYIEDAKDDTPATPSGQAVNTTGIKFDGINNNGPVAAISIGILGNDGTAIGSLVGSPTYRKADASGYYEAWSGNVFVTGAYEITFTIQPISGRYFTANTAINGTGGSANLFTSSVFKNISKTFNSDGTITITAEFKV